MTSWTATSANPCRRFLRAVLAHAMALAVLITLIIPHHSMACGPLDASSPAITGSADGAGGPSGDPADFGLVQHANCAGCHCHTGVWSSAHKGVVWTAVLDVLPPGPADALPRPHPVSPPFKPPRA